MQSPKQTKNGRWECPAEGCRRTFSAKRGATEHFDNLHQKIGAHCSICKLHLSNKSAVYKHIRSKMCGGKRVDGPPPNNTTTEEEDAVSFLIATFKVADVVTTTTTSDGAIPIGAPRFKMIAAIMRNWVAARQRSVRYTVHHTSDHQQQVPYQCTHRQIVPQIRKFRQRYLPVLLRSTKPSKRSRWKFRCMSPHCTSQC